MINESVMEATALETPLQTSATSQPAGFAAALEEPVSAKYDAVIIGGGPAGMAACIYMARKKLRCLLVTKDLGGQAAKSSEVENYLGYTMITGADLTKHFQDHIKEFSDEITLKLSKDGVKKIEPAGSNFNVVLADGSTETGRAIIITSGKDPRHLGMPGEQEYLNRGVTFCAWCDGPQFRGKSIAIIGGGNAALDAAIAVEGVVRDITVINVAPQLTADELLADKATAAQTVRVMNNTVAKRILGDQFVTGVLVEDKATGQEKEIAVEGVFIEIGSVPATDYLKGLLKLNDDGEIVVDKANMTSVEGIFAAGDVTDTPEKQIIVAAGEGAKAGIQCAKWLAGRP